MPSLNPLEQLAVDAFTAALETCREEDVELPEEVWAIAQSPEQHVADLSEIAKQHPQLNANYRMARKLLGGVDAERHKRMNTSDQPQLEQYQFFTEGLIIGSEGKLQNSPSVNLEKDGLSTSTSDDNAKTSGFSHYSGSSNVAPSSPIQPVIYRYTLPDTASPQAAIAFSKQVEMIRQSNPDWVVSFDRPNPGEADAIVLIHKDEHYATTHAAYLTNQTLNQIVGPALSRIFGAISSQIPEPS
jgi:hypothetical protein